MNSIEFPTIPRLFWVLAVVAAFHRAEAAMSVTDPTLQVSLVRTSQSIIVSWGGVAGVPYQVEASSTLTAWTDVSPVMTGTGSQLSFTISSTGQSRGFFRVKRVFPATPGSATFNPSTGVLTIVADALHTGINGANDGTAGVVISGGGLPLCRGGGTTAHNGFLT